MPLIVATSQLQGSLALKASDENPISACVAHQSYDVILVKLLVEERQVKEVVLGSLPTWLAAPEHHKLELKPALVAKIANVEALEPSMALAPLQLDAISWLPASKEPF